jgi:hypothetical protein
MIPEHQRQQCPAVRHSDGPHNIQHISIHARVPDMNFTVSLSVFHSRSPATRAVLAALILELLLYNQPSYHCERLFKHCELTDECRPVMSCFKFICFFPVKHLICKTAACVWVGTFFFKIAVAENWSRIWSLLFLWT